MASRLSSIQVVQSPPAHSKGVDSASSYAPLAAAYLPAPQSMAGTNCQFC